MPFEPVLVNLLIASVVVFLLIYTVWAIHLKINDASIIDLVWGAGFGLVAIALLVASQPPTPYQFLLAGLPLIWAVRYTTFIFLRNLGHGEDRRYTDLRKRKEKTGIPWPVYSFFFVYGFQALAMIFVSSPLIIAMATGKGVVVGPLAWAGAAIWIVGFFFEAIGDLQLALFKKKHRDYNGPDDEKPVLDRGLWRYTRHPNYFGNACMWWGIGIIACAAPWGWVGLIGPAFMNFALVFLTGKANNESLMTKRKSYREYVKRTSGFIPWFPKST